MNGEVYKGVAQYKKMKQLTYHHIRERSKGGRATVKNGAILSVENHQWFNKQSKEKQAEMNRKFQEYKELKIVPVDDLETEIEIHTAVVTPEDLIPQYNRAKVKRETRKMYQDYEGRE